MSKDLLKGKVAIKVMIGNVFNLETMIEEEGAISTVLNSAAELDTCHIYAYNFTTQDVLWCVSKDLDGTITIEQASQTLICDCQVQACRGRFEWACGLHGMVRVGDPRWGLIKKSIHWRR